MRVYPKDPCRKGAKHAPALRPAVRETTDVVLPGVRLGTCEDYPQFSSAQGNITSIDNQVSDLPPIEPWRSFR